MDTASSLRTVTYALSGDSVGRVANVIDVRHTLIDRRCCIECAGTVLVSEKARFALCFPMGLVEQIAGKLAALRLTQNIEGTRHLSEAGSFKREEA